MSALGARVPPEERSGRLCLIASRETRDGSLAIHQDVDVYAARLAPRASLVQRSKPGRHAWLPLIGRELDLGGREPAGSERHRPLQAAVLLTSAKE